MYKMCGLGNLAMYKTVVDAKLKMAYVCKDPLSIEDWITLSSGHGLPLWQVKIYIGSLACVKNELISKHFVFLFPKMVF